MSHVFLKITYSGLGNVIETERVERVTSNQGSVWDFRYSLSLLVLKVLKPEVEELIKTHFLMLTEDSRVIVFASILNLTATEKDFVDIKLERRIIEHGHR